MSIEVLLSCMNQKDSQIVSRTNIQSNAVVINQSNNENTYIINVNGISVSKIKFINTKERGLSKSRNMALRNATGDICLICDDDEILNRDYVEKIQTVFINNPKADIIAFQIADAGKKYPNKKKKIGYLGALKLASWQLAFRRKSIIDNDIWFDETLGSGVSKAGGEENMFLYDCLKKGLNIIFVPITIGCMIEGESQWFHGYTCEYFYDRGIMTRKLLGKNLSFLYAIYYLVKKYPLYHKDVSFFHSLQNIFKGICS